MVGSIQEVSFNSFVSLKDRSKRWRPILLLSERVGIANKEEVHARILQCEELGKMLRSLIRSMQAKKE
jgi:hypothetical protein